MAPANKAFTKTAVFVLKLSVSSTLLYLLFEKIGGRAIINNIKLLNPFMFVVAVGMYLVATYFSSLRWKLLLPQGLTTKRLFSIYMMGSFFNTYMPGIIGGDAVKAYYLSTELKKGQTTHSKGHEGSLAIASVFMDRYIGFFALLIIGLISFPFGFKYIAGSPVKWALPAISTAFMLLSVAIFKLRVGARLKFLVNIYEYFQFYSSKKDVLVKAFVYSLIVQILGIMAVYILSEGLALNISFLSLLIFVPIIIIVSLIPVSISGIGLREGAFAFLLGSMGVRPDLATTLSLIWFLSVVVASLLGLFEYLRYKAVLGREEE